MSGVVKQHTITRHFSTHTTAVAREVMLVSAEVECEFLMLDSEEDEKLEASLSLASSA